MQSVKIWCVQLMNFYICIYPCNLYTQIKIYYISSLLEVSSCSFLVSYFPSPSLRGNHYSDIYYIVEFCLFLGFMQIESCSIFYFCVWLLLYSVLSLRFIHAMFSYRLFFIVILLLSIFLLGIFIWIIISSLWLLWAMFVWTVLNLFCWVNACTGPPVPAPILVRVWLHPAFLLHMSAQHLWPDPNPAPVPTRLALSVSWARGAKDPLPQWIRPVPCRSKTACPQTADICLRSVLVPQMIFSFLYSSGSDPIGWLSHINSDFCWMFRMAISKVFNAYSILFVNFFSCKFLFHSYIFNLCPIQLLKYVCFSFARLWGPEGRDMFCF